MPARPSPTGKDINVFCHPRVTDACSEFLAPELTAIMLEKCFEYHVVATYPWMYNISCATVSMPIPPPSQRGMVVLTTVYWGDIHGALCNPW